MFILFGLLPRRDRTDYRDIFVREASIRGAIRQHRFLMGDTCKFDIIRSELLHLNNSKQETYALLFSSWTRFRSSERLHH